MHLAEINVARMLAPLDSALDHPHLACWWATPGTQPTVAEGKARLELLERVGVS